MDASGPPPVGPRGRARLTRSGDFDTVYRRGRSAANRHLVVYAFPRPGGAGTAPGPARLGLSVSRKVGNAVARNRVKRALRERFAEIAPRLPAGLDIVVIGRPGVAEYLAERGSGALGERLGELAGRVAPCEEAA